MGMRLSRRGFIGASAAALAAAGAVSAQDAPAKQPVVCVFSKHLQGLSAYDALAAQARGLGFDGIDLTVREGGHVLPGRAAEDLPRAVAAIRAEGLEVPMITTRIADGDDPDARPVLEAAARAGIRHVRVGGHRYPFAGNPIAFLDSLTTKLRSLASLLEEYGLEAGYHNHSGMLNVGAPVWDLHYLLERVGSEHLGSNFDLGHAMVEGSYGDWQITTRLIAPRTKMVSVKDFRWAGNKPEWTPLGDGIVPITDMLRLLRAARFRGPVSIHFEYDLGDETAALEHMRRDVQTLKSHLSEAGFA